MFDKTIVALVSSIFVAAAFAGPAEPMDRPGGFGEPGFDIDQLPAATEFRSALKAGPTDAEVGDSDSFGREKTYLGVMQTQSVTLRADCSGFPPDAGPCIELNPAPASTSVDESDLAVIELPKKATNSILCFTFTPFANWSFNNTTASPATAQMLLRPRVRIESEVLDDPSLINPQTGFPFGGVLFDNPVSNALQLKTLQPGETEFHFTAVTRSCTGGLVNKRVLSTTYGLSDSQIKDFFKKPITVSFGVLGSVALVDSASYSVGVRLYGD